MLAPVPDREEAQGVEDPTLSAGADETAVYSSGWNRANERTRCCRVARASRRRTNAASQSAIVRRANPKEVTLARASEGSWETNAIELLADRASGTIVSGWIVSPAASETVGYIRRKLLRCARPNRSCVLSAHQTMLTYELEVLWLSRKRHCSMLVRDYRLWSGGSSTARRVMDHDDHREPRASDKHDHPWIEGKRQGPEEPKRRPLC